MDSKTKAYMDSEVEYFMKAYDLHKFARKELEKLIVKFYEEGFEDCYQKHVEVDNDSSIIGT